MTETESETRFEPRSSAPSGRTARLSGSIPTGICRISRIERTSTTDALSLVVLAAKCSWPEGSRTIGSTWGLAKV